MSPEPSPLSWRSHARTILLAGLATGICDITAAFLHAGLRSGVSPVRVLKFVASGAFGDAAFKGGNEMAAAGLFCHFLIATIWATLFYAASRRFAFLTSHPVWSGLLYGIVVHKLMQKIVVPLSNAPQLGPDTTLWNPIFRYLIHMFCVGLPLALVIARRRRREEAGAPLEAALA